MPLLAIEQKTGNEVYAPRLKNPRSTYVLGDLVCPECGAILGIVTPTKRITHFRHMHGVECPDIFGKDAELETIEHIASKIRLLDFLEEKYPPEKGYKVSAERVVKEAGRRADVYLEDPNGWHRAYEIQFAAISNNQLEERTRAYERAGIDVVWLFGGAAQTQSNILWAHERFMPVYKIDVVIGVDTEKYAL